MSDADGLMAEIRAGPDDDAPRLVLADWLDDHGEADRAEFVRLQVRLGRTPEYDPEHFELQERSRDLLAEHRTAWTPRLPQWGKEVRTSFCRGLPETARLPSGVFRRHGASLARKLPLLRRAELTTEAADGEAARQAATVGVTELEMHLRFPSADQVARQLEHLGDGQRLRRLSFTGGMNPAWLSGALVAWPGLARLTGLGFRQDNTGDDYHGVFGSPRLGELHWLELGVAGPGMVGTLARAERLAGLCHLRLSTAGDAARGLTAARWRELQRLRLIAMHLGEDGTREVLRSRWMASLRSLELDTLHAGRGACSGLLGGRPTLSSLRLSGLDDGAEWCRCLAQADESAGLAALELDGYGFGTEGAAALAGASKFGRLHRLRLATYDHDHSWGVWAADVFALVESPRLAALRELRIRGANLQSPAGDALSGLSGLSRLRSLALERAGITRQGAAALARSRHLGGLARLDLYQCDLGDEGVRALLGAAWLPSLRELGLGNNDVTDRGVAALAGCPALARLRVLDLRWNRVTDAGAAALAASPHLDRLLCLALHDEHLSPAGRQRLRERFGHAVDFSLPVLGLA